MNITHEFMTKNELLRYFEYDAAAKELRISCVVWRVGRRL